MTGFPMLPDLPDGIYFGLAEEVYFALPRLSASGIQNLAVSPADFWAASWLNKKKAVQLAGSALAAITSATNPPPWAEPHAKRIADAFPDAAKAAQSEESTKAQQLGKAYHCARLEPETFEARFVRKPERADFDANGACWTGTDIERELVARDQPKKQAGENVAAQGARLRAAGFEGTIYPLEMAEWEAKRGNRVAIDAAYWDDLICDMEWLHDSPVAKRLLVGGAAEVACLWSDAQGRKWKCKIDYLMPDAWADLKTFANVNGKHLERVLTDAFQYGRHHIQGVVYREAVEMIRANALAIIGPATDRQVQLIGQINLAPADLECHFVYQQKSGVPNTLAREMVFFEVPENIKNQHAGATEEGIARVEEATRTMTFVHRRARQDIAQAVAAFDAYCEIYEPGRPWHPWQPFRKFDDLDFNDKWLSGEWQ